MRRALILGLVVATATAVSGRVAAQSRAYVVGPQDVLAISVWEQPSLSGKFSVEADGTFTFPLIGRVRVGGLSLRDVEAELGRRLEDQKFLKNPQVSVTVDQYRSQRIFVVGEVRTPGAYPLTGEMTLIEALARAGSTTERARDEAIIVHHMPGAATAGPLLPDDAASSQVVRINLKQLQSGIALGTLLLGDGDTVFVPRAETVFVFGQVRNPGTYPIQSDTTVLQALSLAGGVTDRGAVNRVRTVRMVDGAKQERRVSLDDLVKPGDTIVVPERFF